MVSHQLGNAITTIISSQRSLVCHSSVQMLHMFQVHEMCLFQLCPWQRTFAPVATMR